MSDNAASLRPGRGHAPDAGRAGAALATRLSFLAAGMVMAAWAPLVPHVKAQVGAGDAELGLLLLCLGVGSIVAMPLTGYASARTGARPMILGGGFGLVAVLPALVLIGDPLLLGVALLMFGAALGTIDVAMNVHAAEVERAAGRPMMSGFHAMWSVGGIAGAGGMTALLSQGVAHLPAAALISAAAAACLAIAASRFLPATVGQPPAFALPRGIVLVLAGLTAVIFLVEGAILDWGALLLVGRGLVDPAQGGLGFMLFSVAMTAGRLSGDLVVRRLGPRRVLVAGGALAVAGFGPVLLGSWPPLALSGFVMIGLGASNLVPVLFSLAGRQGAMAPGLAIAAVTTTGYAGILVGPALVGVVAEGAGLPGAFWMLAALVVLVPLAARAVTRG